jgi:hypothetical protein
MNTTYDEVLTMLYLSKLIYDYHENDKFHLEINEKLIDYINRIENEYEEQLNDMVFINIKDALIYLSSNYPNSKIYDFVSNENTDIQCGILVCDKNITFSFKGTDSLIDCYYDLNFLKRNIDLSKIEIHKGFFDQLMSIYDTLLLKIKELLLINPYFNINITGHSAGSGQGTMFAYLLSKIYPNKFIKLITFGGPKLGNYEWKKSFDNIKNIIHYRITNDSDIITQIPNIQYYHVGKNIHLTDNDIFIKYENKGCNYKSCLCNVCCDCGDEFCNDCVDNNNTCYLCSVCQIFTKINYLNINNHKIDYYYKNLITKKNIWQIKFKKNN